MGFTIRCANHSEHLVSPNLADRNAGPPICSICYRAEMQELLARFDEIKWKCLKDDIRPGLMSYENALVETFGRFLEERTRPTDPHPPEPTLPDCECGESGIFICPEDNPNLMYEGKHALDVYDSRSDIKWKALCRTHGEVLRAQGKGMCRR